MNTITAKELRDNLGSIAKRVEAGEHIRVSYRNKISFRISPEQPAEKLKPGSNDSISNFVKRVNMRKRATDVPVFDPDKSIKELYREMLDNDPKYKPPYHG